MTNFNCETGDAQLQGTTYDGRGVNFALFSEEATRVELCLFANEHDRSGTRITLPGRTGHIHHGYVHGITPGQLYGYRVHGEFAPEDGRRFNPRKLLLDPRARGICMPDTWNDALLGDLNGVVDERDSAPYAPLGVVLNEPPPLERGPRVPISETILYETHVKSISAAHPDLPPEMRGTFAGLGSRPVLEHLTGLGVTSVELLPIFQHFPEVRLQRAGLPNFWGYNTIGFFAPDARYAATGARPDQVLEEFRTMVRALHGAGLELVLDVVFNHTAEGDETGPTLAFRGIDNAAYYRLDPADPARYQNHAGCGNTLNVSHPHVLRMILDSLRYWCDQGVDGFRFDLGTCLARDRHGDFQPDAAFFGALWSDPVLSRRKLIVEPWDPGPDGYRPGEFPEFFQEWNDRFRDGVRRFWVGTAGPDELATRLTGSSDRYQAAGRGVFQGINFITAHDGFSLSDLVSYDHKHNEYNLEENRDGHDHNHSWNCGVEGASNDPAVLALRARQKRNLLLTLLFARGTPMLSGGDELGLSRAGNNNAYCLDNRLNYYDWRGGERDPTWLDFVRAAVRLRKRLSMFARPGFLSDRIGEREIAWLDESGRDLNDETWPAARGLVFVTGENQPVLLILHPAAKASDYLLPALPADLGPLNDAWRLLIDTGRELNLRDWNDPLASLPRSTPGDNYTMASHSLALFRGEFPAET